MKRKKELIIALAFYIPLLVIGALYLFSPPDEISELEKRKLQQRPKFSVQAVVSGEFSQELDRYFTDQLPFRNLFISSDQRMQSNLSTLFGLNRVQLITGPAGDLGEGENLGTDDKEIVVFPTKAPMLSESGGTPGSEPSDSSPLASPTPGESGEPTDSEAPSETTTVKPTVTPTEASTEAPTEPPESTSPPTEAPNDVSVSGGILIVGDRAMEIFYSSQATIDKYTALVNKIEATSGSAQVYSLLAPTASQFYAPEGYRQGSSNQQTVIPSVYAQMSGNIKTVDAYSALAPHTGEYLYFRSDHHWTGLGAYYAYTAFANTAGFSPLPLSSYTKGRVDGDFLGTLYAWAGSPSVLKSNPDYVEYWQPPVTATGYAFTDASMSSGYQISLIKPSVDANNKYLAFTEGDHGLAKFETSTKNGRSIMVIKESYGNAIVPYLASHYENIYVFDPRKATISMSSFVNSEGIDDILVVNYSIAIGNTGWIDALYKSLN